MTQTLFAWFLLIFALIAAYPCAAVIRRHLPTLEGDSAWLTWLLALAISTGGITQIFLLEGMLNIPYSWQSISIPYFALMAVGVVLWWRGKPRFSFPRFRLNKFEAFILACLSMIALAILFNALYLPLYRDDTLGIYRPFAVEMNATGILIPLTGADSLYRAYPMMIPFSYTYAYLASGWHNDYLAKLFSVLLAVGCLPAAYTLTRLISPKRAAWIGAFLLAVTPTFSRWASSGYVDLPMAFFYTLGAIFALRLWRTQHALDAILAGIMFGLAAWAKNAGLLGIPLFGAWLIWCSLNRRIDVKTVVAGAFACVLIAAPWYLRNLIGAGFIMPSTAWTDQAERTLESLLIYVTLPNNFHVIGGLYLAGWGYAALRVMRNFKHSTGELLCLGLTVPFFAAWWLFVSYDPRFLLLFLPIMAALAGSITDLIYTNAKTYFEKNHKMPVYAALKWMTAAFVISMTLYTAVMSVQYKNELLANPFMSHEEKVEMTRGSIPPP